MGCWEGERGGGGGIERGVWSGELHDYEGGSLGVFVYLV